MKSTLQTIEKTFVADPRMKEAMATWNRFSDVFSRLPSVGIAYHADPDGVVSAAYIIAYLKEKFGISVQDKICISTFEFDFGSLKKWIKKSRFDICIITDVSVENDVMTLEEISKNVELIIIYDHHIITETPIISNITLINPTPAPLASDKVPLPAFSFGYNLSRSINLIFPDWLILFCLFSEGVESKITDLSDILIKDIYGSMGSSLSLRQRYQNTPLPRMAALFKAGLERRSSTHDLLDFIVSSIINCDLTYENASSFLERNFSSDATALSQEISSLVDQWRNKLQKDPAKPLSVIAIEVPSHSSAGPVASILRGEFEEYIFLTYYCKDEVVMVEMRAANTSKINFPEIITEIREKMSLFNGGGHPTAAGALLRKNDLPSFIENLQNAVNRLAR